jgi:subtilisin family serine protease
VSWWHELHGVRASDSRRGAGVRIGIIDEGLADPSGQSCIAHVTNKGALAFSSNRSADRALTPATVHGLAVTSLLTSRVARPGGYEGMAPGAEVFFCAAPMEKMPGKVSPARIANAIDFLSEEVGCHLISVSSGDSDQKSSAVYNAVSRAKNRGTLCFFAAGNKAGPPLYPARYDNCLAVAALGRRGAAPRGTAEQENDRVSSEMFDKDHYVWYSSARGNDVEFAAAGSNVIWSYEGFAAKAANGTSYACPVLVGTAASILAKHPLLLAAAPNRSRAEGMLKILTQNTRNTANTSGLCRHGVLEYVP